MAEIKNMNGITLYPDEKQKELFDIVSSAFSVELQTSNCFILTLVQQRIGDLLKENGFERANKATFSAAPSYFKLGYNKKNADAISIIGFPDDDDFSLSKNPDFIPARKNAQGLLTQERQRELAEIFAEIFKEQNKNGKVYLATVGIKAGKIISDAGFGRASVELFKSAPDYFETVEESEGSWMVFLKEDCGVSLSTDKNSSEHKRKNIDDISFEEFESYIKELFSSKNFNIIVEERVLRKAIHHTSGDMWNCIIKSFYALNGIEITKSPTLTDWEKVVIDFESLKSDCSEERLSGFSLNMSAEDVEKYVDSYMHSVENFSLVGQRIQSLCGTNNPLAMVFYELGLIAGLSNDRQFCFRLLLQYYSYNDKTKISFIWDKYAEKNINPANMTILIGTWFLEKEFVLIKEYIKKYYEFYDESELMQLYYEYSDALLGNSSSSLPPLTCLKYEYAIDLVKTFLGCAIFEDKSDLYFRMLICCFTTPKEYIIFSDLSEIILKQTDYISKHYELLVQNAKNDGDYLFLLSKLIELNIIKPDESWQMLSNSILEDYKLQIGNATVDEKRKLLLEAIRLFPDNDYFTSEFVSLISVENEDDICVLFDRLIDSANYLIITSIFENHSEIEALNSAEVLKRVSICYQQQNEHLKSLDIEIRIILSLVEKDDVSTKSRLTDFLFVLYNGFVSSNPIVLDCNTASNYLSLFNHYKCETKDAHYYAIVIMGLAFYANNIPLLSMMFAVSKPLDNENNIFAYCENAISTTETGYSHRLGDFQRTFEYVITQEKPDIFFNILGKISNVIQNKQDVSIYNQLRNTNIEDMDTLKIITLIVSEYNKERAWRLLSQLAIKSKKYALNFVANCVWLYMFKDTSHPLSNCTRALDRYVDDGLPRNFLWCCLEVLKTSFHGPITVFENALINHISRCQSFVNANHSVAEAYLEVLSLKEKPKSNDFLLLSEIALQSDSFDVFCNECIANNRKYLSLLKKDLALVVRFCVSACSARDDGFLSALPIYKQVRTNISFNGNDSKEYAVLLWIDGLLECRKSPLPDSKFLEGSIALLSAYPNLSSPDVITKWVTHNATRTFPNSLLIRNWINTFGSIRTVKLADSAYLNYVNKNWLPDDSQELAEFFRMKLFLSEKYIYYYDRMKSEPQDNYLRRCHAFFGYRILANITSSVPESFKSKMEKDLAYLNKLDRFRKIQTGVEKFVDNVDDEVIRRLFLYCGITNYWDVCFEQCLNSLDKLSLYSDEIVPYTEAVDCHPLRRRLLQMYLYSSIAQTMIESGNEYENLSSLNEVQMHYNSFVELGVDASEYIEKTERLIEIVQPKLIEIITSIKEADSFDERIGLIRGVYFALANKNISILQNKFYELEKLEYNSIAIKTILAIQYKRNIKEFIFNMSLKGESAVLPFFDYDKTTNTIGESECELLKSAYYSTIGDFEKARLYYNHSSFDDSLFNKLSEQVGYSIDNEKALVFEFDSISGKKEFLLPEFSFFRVTDPNGVKLSQLISDYYADNLYDARGKCSVASKILFYYKNGEFQSDIEKFIFDWGFTEIDALSDVEKKAGVLFELLDNIGLIEPYKPLFKESFVKNFLYVLQEFDYNYLFNNFERIYSSQQILYKEFYPYSNCDCYAQTLALLKQLFGIDINKYEPKIIDLKVDKIKSDLIELHINKYPQNRFVNKCIEFVERFLKKIRAKGNVEIRILNHNNEFDGVIYYQIHNIGFEILSNIYLTFEVNGLKDRIELNTLMPNGLRPDQIFAGEYSIARDFDNGTSICCGVTIEYTSYDESGKKIYTSYLAIDPKSADALNVFKSKLEAYHKNGDAGYIEEPIKRDSDFVGREEKIEIIMGKILKGDNVLLFGTNGTGKSSILHYIRKKSLSNAYENKSNRSLGKTYYATELKFDSDCTERIVLNSIVNSISSQASLFKSFIRHNATDETIDIIEDVTAYWTKHGENNYDENDFCQNTDNLRQFFNTLDEALDLSDLDVYILIDQFERVISSKNIDSNHMLFLRDLSSQRIRFILAGSNYLLEEVSVDKISNQNRTAWSDIFSRGFEKEKIGNMIEEDFKLLIKQDSALNNGYLTYSDEAIQLLWKYTKGHALYSCLLGNRTLDIMSSRQVKRNIIYPSDVFIAIYQSGKYLPGEKSNKGKEIDIKKQIFQDINDNIAIKLVGKALATIQSSGELKVSYQRLKDYVENHRPDILDELPDSLSVLIARDFISYDEIDVPVDEQKDLFNTENTIENAEYYFTSDLYLEHFITIPVPKLSEEERKRILHRNRSLDDLADEIKTMDLSPEEIELLREKLPNLFTNGTVNIYNIDRQYNDQSRDESIGIQNNYQINAQFINSSINTLLTPGLSATDYINALDEFPKLSAFVSNDKRNEYESLRLQLMECTKPDEYEELSEKIEPIATPAKEQMIGAVQKAAINSPNFFDLPKERWVDLIGITKNELEKRIPSEFMPSLSFAILLHNVFDTIMLNTDDEDETLKDAKKKIDYCPVAIMYCKVIEAMLKKLHTPIYVKRIESATVDKKGKTFAQLVKRNGKINYYDKDLTIGSFSYTIAQYPPYIKTIECFENEIIEKLDVICDITGIKEDMAPLNIIWTEHAKQVAIVAGVRNKSAHDATPISFEIFNWLIKTLFGNGNGEGEIYRLAQLANENYPTV
ncbi:MAG: hypothetical protein E7570_02240 [Ruminococcaceae bacterium]|nr:hypothetical protein [Oscillospiraceae bacterium]